MPPIIFYKDDNAIRGLGVGLPSGVLVGRSGERVVASDTFTDVDGTALQSHVPSGGGAWVRHSSSTAGGTHLIGSNRVYSSVASSIPVHYHNHTPSTPNYLVEADVVLLTDNNSSTIGVAGRILTNALTFYYARYTTSGDIFQLFKSIANVSTQLGTSVAHILSVGVGTRLGLDMDGTLISMLIDGEVVMSATDSDITAAGRAGIRSNNASTLTTGVHLDNWQVIY